MITKVEAAQQVGRLAQMLGYPRREEPHALQELILATMAAKDMEIAKRVIGNFLETANSETRCPMPADIRRAMYAAERPDYWEPEWGKLQTGEACSDCDGTGWRIVERGGLSGADRCHCKAKPVEAA